MNISIGIVVLWLMTLIGAPLLQTQPEPRIVTANGIDFEYFIEGTGRTCLVVGDALTVSRAISPELQSHFRFVFLSSRMTTSSNQIEDVSDMTLDNLVKDIEYALRALQLGQVCVFGHSISGIVALEYARQYPHYTTHVIMYGTPPFADERYGPVVREFWDTNASQRRKNQLEANWDQVSKDSLRRLPPGEAMIRQYIINAPRYFHDPSYDPAWLFEEASWNKQHGIGCWG